MYRRRSGGFAIDGAIEELSKFLDEKSLTPRGFNPRPGKYAKPKLLHKAPFSSTHSEQICVAWSDWHIAETVRKQDSNGVNEYNSLIAANRVHGVVDKEKRILTGHSALYQLKKINLFMLGDMINGSIHEELKLTNDLLDIPATVLAAELAILGIDELKTLGMPIEVHCVIGNHPRVTAKMPTKRQAHLSMDYLVYEQIARAYRKDDQVKVNVHTGQLAITEILGHRYILEHGMGLTNGKEEDFEDRLRGVYDDATFRKATGLKGTSFDQIVVGDRHKAKWLERTIVNGCLTGQNELGVSWHLKTIKALQLMWGITEEQVRTWCYDIDVTSITSEKSENSFSEFATWFMKKHRR